MKNNQEPHREAFLKELEENPMDEVARHIFADWLDEQGETEEANRQRQYVPSRKWLTDYAVRLKPYDVRDWTEDNRDKTPEEVYQIMMEEITMKGQVFAHGIYLHSLGELKEAEAFFKHLAVVLGYPISPEELEYGCSC